MSKQFDDPLTYYAQHGPITNPGKFSRQFADLSHEIPELCQIVQGFLLHIFWADKYGVTPTKARRADVWIRHVERLLARGQEIDPGPLTKTRSPANRLIGNCRTFAVLLCAILRSQGVPARARCGFARYFAKSKHEDHWVCEYWDSTRHKWVMVDAQLDDLQCQALQITFDPLNVPGDQFLVGGKAWQLCRSQRADPATFGIFDMTGLWFVRGDLVRDIAALNKVELLPWDGWGLIEGQDQDISQADLAFLDQIAAASVDETDYPTVRALYTADTRLLVPEVIRSYTESGVQSIDVATEKIFNQGTIREHAP